MNLFDNIIKSSVNKFLGTTTPSVPSFTTPQAPRTMNYTQPTAPVAKKPSMTLFSDEQKMFQKMKADNLPDETAFSMLKKRRMDILGGNDLANDEKTILLKMQADNVPVKQAVSMIQQRRKDQFEKKYQEGNLLQKGAYNTLAFAAGNLETLAKYSGNTLDFITGGTMGFGDEVKKMEQVTQSPEFSESSAFTAGTYAPDVALAVSPIGGGYLAGAKGMTGLQGAKLLSTQGAKNLSQGLMGRSAVVGAGFGGIQPILDKGSDATMKDIATSAAEGGAIGAVATPVIGKALKYGQAGYRGGLTGMGKSITRDVNAVKTGVQKGIQNRADIASTNINRMNAGQIRSFNDEIGVSPGKFLNDRGINDTGDTLVENLSKNLKLSRKAADDGLANIKGNFKAPTQEVATSTVDDTGKFVTKKVDPVETMLRDNLDNASSKGMSKESLRAKELLEKYQNEGLSMTEINEAKRFLNANNKFSYFSDDVSPRKGFVTNLDNEVRKWQFQTAEQQGFSNLKDINKDTKAYYKLLEGIGGWQDKIAGNNPMGLTDWLAFNADPTIFLAKQVAQSNLAKRTYLKGLNALSGRKVQPEIKKPTNLSKNGIPNSSNSGNVPSSKRVNVKTPVIGIKVNGESNIPGAKKTTVEVPSNPKGNQNTILAKKQVKTVSVPTAKEIYLQTPKGLYASIRKKMGDNRYSDTTYSLLITKFKEKTGIDLMKNPNPQFDADGNVVKTKKLTK